MDRIKLEQRSLDVRREQQQQVEQMSDPRPSEPEPECDGGPRGNPEAALARPNTFSWRCLMCEPFDSDEDPVLAEAGADDLAEHAVAALKALEALGRPSRTSDRSRLWKYHRLPFQIGAFLGRRGAIAPPGGDGAKADERIITAKGRAWIENPAIVCAEADVPSSYVRSIHAALAEFAEQEGLPVGDRKHILERKGLWPKNLWPPLAQLRQLFPAEGDLHKWVHHLRSSQAFAFNLFGPLAAGLPWARTAWGPVFGEVRRVQFEYPNDSDPGGDDPLRERTPERPHRTRVDVRVDHGEGETTLVEVKLTEPEFGTCSAARDDDNPQRSTCALPDQSLAEIARSCYLVTTAGRSYFERILAADSLLSPERLQAFAGDGCPLRNGLYQLARNLMIAQHLRSNGLSVRFAVVAPGPALNRSLHGERSLLGSSDLDSLLRSLVREEHRDAVRFVDFERVVEAAPTEDLEAAAWVTYMKRRYIEPLRRAAARYPAATSGE